LTACSESSCWEELGGVFTIALRWALIKGGENSFNRFCFIIEILTVKQKQRKQLLGGFWRLLDPS
jgi:hypothetical protein